MAEQQVIATTDIKRDKGFIYVCKGDPIQIVKIKAGRPKKE